MRVAAVKTEQQQASAMLFPTRNLLVRQRTRLINSPRGQLAEFVVVAPQRLTNVILLTKAVEEPAMSLLILAAELGYIYLDQIDTLSKKIAEFEKVMAREVAPATTTRRLLTMPGAWSRSRPWR